MRESRVILGAFCLVFGACGGKEQVGLTNQGGGQSTAAKPNYGPLQVHVDLAAHAHLADIDEGGLLLDFGTPARWKYTTGDWKTGWGRDVQRGALSYTTVTSTTARAFFPVSSASPLVLRFRLKPVGTQNMLLFLNNNALPSLRFDGGNADFSEYSVEVPQTAVQAGENHLLMRFSGTSPLEGENVAAAIDWIRVLPASAPQTSAPPRPLALANIRAGGVVRKALAVSAPSTLSWYVEVPQSAKLGLGVGSSKNLASNARVVVTPEGGSPIELYRQPIKAGWTDRVLPLDRFAGQIVRVDLQADAGGGGGIAWSSPQILVPPRRPKPKGSSAQNVVILLIDTMRADKLHPFNPRTRVQSPVMDALAADGTIFQNAQAPENWTKPSVASVLTSLYPESHGAKTDSARLPDGATMLSEVYKKAGFTTASFIANGYVSDRFGFDQGWDHYTNFIREKKSTQAEKVFGEAAEWVEANKDKRFFLYIQTIDPHVPYDPPEEFLQMYDRSEYTGPVQPRLTAEQLEKAKRNPPAITFSAEDRRRLEALHDGEVSYHDRELGRFIDRLKALGVYDKTLFVVTSDHGEEFNDHGSFGHGHTVYQELLHVPLLFRFPGSVPTGRRIDHTVSTVSIAPTVLELTGVQGLPDAEGRSLVGDFEGGQSAQPAVAFSEFLDSRRVIRAGRWKLIWKGSTSSFYDLERDPGEQHELAASRHPIAMRYCRILLGQFLGSRDRAHWLEGRLAAKRARFNTESIQVDETLRGQLKALGYAN